jgi:hypothetical protein
LLIKRHPGKNSARIRLKAAMAENTTTTRLPPEVWDRVFDFLLPIQEVELQEWRRDKDRTWQQYAPAVRCTSHEDRDLDMAVRALTETPNLLFRGSRLRYWITLMHKAVWRIEWDPDEIRQPGYNLIKLEHYFGSSVHHVAARIDDTDHEYGPTDTHIWEEDQAEGTISLALDVLHHLRQLQSFVFRVEVEDEDAEGDEWLSRENFQVIFEKRAWKDSLNHYGPIDFHVVYQTFHRVDGKLKLYLEEDITGVWSLGLEEIVEECLSHRADEDEIEEMLRLVAEYGHHNSCPRACIQRRE